MLRYWAAGAFTLGCITGCASLQVVTLPNHAYPPLSTAEQRMVADTESGLEQLAQKSRTADSLLQYYRQRAILASWQRPHRIIPVAQPSHPRVFYVVPDVADTVAAGEGVILAAFHHSSRTVFLRANHFAPLLRGLVLAHEIAHAQRYLEQIAPKPHERYDRYWRLDEAAVAVVVDQILNEYTAGAWEAAVQAALARRRLAADASGHPIGQWITRLVSGEDTAVQQLFPELAPYQYLLLLDQFLIALNLRLSAVASDAFRSTHTTETLALFIGSLSVPQHRR